jgi:thiol-disulfide isomerase/thioredoxin
MPSLLETVDDEILLNISKALIRYCSSGNSEYIFKRHFPAFKIVSEAYFCFSTISLNFMDKEDVTMLQMNIKWPLVCSIVFILSVIVAYPVSGARNLAIKKGMTLPEIKLVGAGTPEVQKYLGLENLEPFTLSQIKTKLILVEFYSFYCPHCQEAAPTNNKLFKYIRKSSKLKNDVKMIGIALTNKPFEVNMFRETFHVTFPLFPDEDKAILDKLGIQWTPVMVLMKPDGTVLIAHYGMIKDLKGFISEIEAIHSEM